MGQAVQACKGERTLNRLGRSVRYYSRTHAGLVASGAKCEGKPRDLAVALANRARKSSWCDLLRWLTERGLSGVQSVVRDDHEGLNKAIVQMLPQGISQPCYLHFLRSAVEHVPPKPDDNCLREWRWRYGRRDLGEARRDLAASLRK